jgi:hypothetical protein
MTSAVVWLILAVVGLAYEFFALKDQDDAHMPLTYHLRKLGHRTWVRVGMIAFWLWLPLHLLGILP